MLLNQIGIPFILGITSLKQIHLQPVCDLLLPALGPQAVSAFTSYGLSPFSISSCLEACRWGCNFTLQETALCMAPGCFAASFQTQRVMALLLLLPSAMKLVLPLHLLKGLLNQMGESGCQALVAPFPFCSVHVPEILGSSGDCDFS